MAISILSNIASSRAQSRLARNSSALNQSYTQLSSGLRINHASDDAAGLAIASDLDAQARIYAQGARNLNDGISLLSIAEGAVDALTNIAIRQKELAEQAANGTLGMSQRNALDAEAQSLEKEFRRIIQATTFNNLNLIDGSFGSRTMQAGDSGIAIALADASQVMGTTGDGTFNSGVTLDNSWNGNVALADLNLDGHLDAVYGDLFSNEVLVRLGNGNGTFGASRTYLGTSRLEGVQIGDYNGDGIEDILTIGDSGWAGVLLNNGNGTFKAMISSFVAPAGVSPNVVYQMQTADFNGDGKLDILSAVNNGTSLYLALGTGTGNFGAYMNLGGSATASRFDIGDVNGDGILDIAAATYTGSGLEIMIGNGNGTFKSRVAYAVQGTPGAVQLADLNGDGSLDVVTLSYANNSISVLLNNGNGTFKAQTSFATTGRSDLFDDDTLIAADLNGDGFLDIVDNHQTSSSIGYLLGNGDGTFKAEVSLATVATPEGIAVGDLNEDGALELVGAGLKVFTANTKYGIVSIEVDLKTISSARSTLTDMTKRLNSLTSYEGTIGANQSRLATAVRDLNTSELAFRDATSLIRDADVAQSAAEMVRQKILVDAAAAVLKQANQEPAIALKLLGDV